MISPVAEGLDGKPYNVNADLAAGRVASALRARRLVYMSDVPGLLANPADPESLISTLKTGQVEELKRRGELELRAWVDGRGSPPPGSVFVPFFDERLLVNLVTFEDQ